MWFHTADTLYGFDAFNKIQIFFYNAAPSTRRKSESIRKPSLKKKKFNRIFIQEQRQLLEKECYATNLITTLLNYVPCLKMNRDKRVLLAY